jgi:predicted unusual protein kinase regulating ubiquinone biosynthesis (AarF/ABC1/UbiB family)
LASKSHILRPMLPRQSNQVRVEPVQVHRGRLRADHREVAVKVQHPGSEALMMQDLRNHRNFAAFLQKFELPFDLLSVLAELEHQV